MTDAYDIPYMERTRDYYRAQGYTRDYRWAQHTDTPFLPWRNALSESRVAVITTAMPDTETGRARRGVYATDCSPVPTSLFTDELSWDKQATHTRDVGSFLPLLALENLAREGFIDSLTPRFYSLPTEYSQRQTIETDAPAILELCRQDQADIALLVPL